MELQGLLKELSRMRLLVVMVLALGVLAAVATAYKIPSFEKRSLKVGAATSQILVDSERSTLVAGAGPDQISALGTRARVYAQYLSSRDAVAKISRQTGIPSSLIMARGPFSQGTGISNYDQQPAESRAKDLVDESRRYRLVFEAQEDVPIITVYATGPDAPQALKLAGSSFTVLNRYIAALKRQAKAAAAPTAPTSNGSGEAVPALGATDVVVRELGAPEGGDVGGKADIILMLLAFLAVVGVSCLVIALLSRLRQQRRIAHEVDELTTAAMMEMAEAQALRDGPDGSPNGHDDDLHDRRSHAGAIRP
jgi:hypothetical protein